MAKNKRYLDYSLIFSAVFALTMVILAIVGAVNNFTSIPHMDMWRGTLNFILQIKEGNFLEFFAFHNEHRIILSNILFFIDYQFFGGASVFLIVINYFLVAVACYLFWLYIKAIFIDEYQYKKNVLIKLFLFIVGLLFLWTQYENLTWAFQSQFFLAQLIPLLALYWQARSMRFGLRNDFMIACFLGVISAGTMANGVLILPIMLMFSLFAKQDYIKNIILLLFSIIVPFVYFSGYSTPAGHSGIRDAILADPVALIHYSLFYIGSPFYFLFGLGDFGKGLALHTGLFLTFFTIFFAYRFVLLRSNSFFLLALIFFIAYIGGTAFGTAGGRIIFGLNQAFAYRYTTPALMAWSALIIIMFHHYYRTISKCKWQLWLTMTIIIIVSVNYQVKALKFNAKALSDKNLGALALALHVDDDPYIKLLNPDVLSTQLYANKAQVQGISIFAHYPFNTISPDLGSVEEVHDLDQCVGSLDQVVSLTNDSKFAKVDGWIFEPTKKEIPYLMRFINNQGLVVGYALTGTPRTDVKNAVDQDAELSGFRGYILKAAATTNTINAVADHPDCKISFNISPLIYDISSLNSKANIAFVSNRFILKNNGFAGSDFFKSNFPDRKIYGSIVNSDADRGKIKLKVNKGEYLYYRSGPTKGRQYIKIGNYKAVLPEALEWVVLKPIDPDNADSFEVEFMDDGDSWGEWSAIAVMDN